MSSRETNENEEAGGVDALLRDHFSAALDGQVGRSRRAFERHVLLSATTTTTAAPHAAHAPARTRDRRGRMIAALGVGLAASIAAIFAVPILREASHKPVAGAAGSNQHAVPGVVRHRAASPVIASPHHVPATTAAAVSAYQFQKVDEVLTRHAQVEGLIVIDEHTPARIVRERAVERTQWVDERRGLRIETIVPREDVKLIHLETH